jgi:hypothetical protein
VFDLTAYSENIYPTPYSSVTYPMSTLCDYGVVIPDGTGDRLYQAMYPSAGLVRYNHVTGERHHIFVGEVERLGSVSPRGTYARIGLGGSGIIDKIQDSSDDFDDPKDWPLVIRLSDGAFMGYVPSDAIWLSDQHLWYDRTLYTITSHGITRSPMHVDSEVLLSQPETGHMIVRTKAGEYGLYSLFEQRMTPLFTYRGPYKVKISGEGFNNPVSSDAIGNYDPYRFDISNGGFNSFHIEFLDEVSVEHTPYGSTDRHLRLVWAMDFRIH